MFVSSPTYLTCPRCYVIIQVSGCSHSCTSTAGYFNQVTTATLSIPTSPRNREGTGRPKNKPYYRAFEKQRPPKRIRK